MVIQNDEAIVFSSTLSKEDFVKANRVWLKMKQDESRFITYIISFFIMIIMIPMSLFGGFDNFTLFEKAPQDNSVTDVPWFLELLSTNLLLRIILIIVFVGMIVLYCIGKYVLPKRHYDSNKIIQQEMKYTFDSEGIQGLSERTNTKILWDEVFKVYLSRDFIIIFHSNMTAWIIPKIHVSGNQIGRLEGMIRENVTKKKVRSSRK